MNDRTGAVSGVVGPKLERPQNAVKSRKRNKTAELTGNGRKWTRRNKTKKKQTNKKEKKRDLQKRSATKEWTQAGLNIRLIISDTHTSHILHPNGQIKRR